MIHTIAFTKTKHFCAFLSLLFILGTSHATSQTQKIGNHSQKEQNHAKVKKEQASKVDKEQSTKVKKEQASKVDKEQPTKLKKEQASKVDKEQPTKLKKKGTKSESNVNKKGHSRHIPLESVAYLIFHLVILYYGDFLYPFGIPYIIAICVEWYRNCVNLWVRLLITSVGGCLLCLRDPEPIGSIKLILRMWLILNLCYFFFYMCITKLYAACVGSTKNPKVPTIQVKEQKKRNEKPIKG